jgi:hypothetical protein
MGFFQTEMKTQAYKLLRYGCILLVFVLLVLTSCFFDTSVELNNNPPECVNYIDSISKVIPYPSTTVCTLHIKDMNDKQFYFSLRDCSFPKRDTIQWSSNCAPFNFEALNSSYSLKQVELSLQSNTIGKYKGFFEITDNYQSAITIPFEINHTFTSPFFDKFETRYWNTYGNNDPPPSISSIDHKLELRFNAGNYAVKHKGIISRFRLAGDFTISTVFDLQEKMDSSFQALFFVSKNPDTGSTWHLNTTGINISNIPSNKRLSFTYWSTSLQTIYNDANPSDSGKGILQLRRHNDTIYYSYFKNKDVYTSTPSVSKLVFNYADTVFVKMEFIINPLLNESHSCLWGEFTVEQGTIIQ